MALNLILCRYPHKYRAGSRYVGLPCASPFRMAIGPMLGKPSRLPIWFFPCSLMRFPTPVASIPGLCHTHHPLHNSDQYFPGPSRKAKYSDTMIRLYSASALFLCCKARSTSQFVMKRPMLLYRSAMSVGAHRVFVHDRESLRVLDQRLFKGTVRKGSRPMLINTPGFGGAVRSIT